MSRKSQEPCLVRNLYDRFLFVCLTAALLGPTPAPAQEEQADDSPATAVVEDFHDSLIVMMKQADELGYQGRCDYLSPVIGRTIDQEFMARKSIGLQWKSLSEADQARWQTAFSRLTVANYAGRFTGYDGEAFETLGQEKAPKETVIVQTKIVLPKEDDVQLNYRLRETDKDWRIIDIYMNGTVSELSLRRSEYSSTLKRDGFEDLVVAVDQKADSLAAEGGAPASAKVN
jgi:phospholipid transport system substrate-binding protein